MYVAEAPSPQASDNAAANSNKDCQELQAVPDDRQSMLPV